jgi:hypothetical protein
MAWSAKISATQLTGITAEQNFDQAPTLSPRESAHCQVAVDFPRQPDRRSRDLGLRLPRWHRLVGNPAHGPFA